MAQSASSGTPEDIRTQTDATTDRNKLKENSIKYSRGTAVVLVLVLFFFKIMEVL
jgi:hypothetical protein